MRDKFIFKGTTTFIDKPRDTVIQNFQNSYVSGESAETAKINAELLKLIELILQSGDLANEVKEDATQALHSVVDQLKQQTDLH
jgi:hypothetical protein